MDRAVLDLYTDYLISSFGQATATGLSALLGGGLSHDRIRRFLAADAFPSADLWQLVKPLVRQGQSEDAVRIVDDTVEAKPSTDESERICWRQDDASGQTVKGVNLLRGLYHSRDFSLPVAFALVTKPDLVADAKTGKSKRQARQTKNALYRQMLRTCVDNALPFRYVLNDIWFASAENRVFVRQELKRDLVMPLQSNRKVALCEADKAQGRYVAVSSLDLEAEATRLIWLEGVPFALRLVRQVFTNGDGSVGLVYLVTSDTTLAAGQLTAIYHRRWKVEAYHKSLQSNLAFAKSPTKTVRTQRYHVFASLAAFVKREGLRLHTKCNHFARKARLYQAALATAFEQLQQLRANCSPA